MTSTWDSFPNPVNSEARVNGNGPTTTPLPLVPPSTPTTPVFSPIPFLHSDARARSKSISPPRTSPSDQSDVEPAFGRVDELDDPRPGHLSDSPTPISSTTTVATTLQDRFVRGEDQEQTKTQGEPEGLGEGDKKEAAERVGDVQEQTTGEKTDEDKMETGDQNTGKGDKSMESEGGEDKENQA